MKLSLIVRWIWIVYTIGYVSPKSLSRGQFRKEKVCKFYAYVKIGKFYHTKLFAISIYYKNLVGLILYISTNRYWFYVIIYYTRLLSIFTIYYLSPNF